MAAYNGPSAQLTPATPGAAGEPRTLAAIGSTILAMFLLAAVDSSSKYLAGTYSPLQIVWVRLLCFSLVLLVASWQQLPEILRPRRPGLQIVRSAILLTEVVFFILAFKFFPLVDVHAIAAICPLLTVVLAAGFLRESVPGIVLVGLMVSLVGMALILSPHVGILRWEMLFPLGGALLWSVYQVMTKVASHHDSAATTAFFTPVVGVLCLLPVMPWIWVMPSRADAALLVGSGLTGAAAHYLIVRAIAMCDTTRLQPFNFTIFVWAIVFGVVLFDDRPSVAVLVGAALVTASSVFCLRAGRSA